MSKDNLLFRYLDAINYSKQNFLLRKDSEEAQRFSKEYVPFVIGGFLGGSLDTVMFANEANTCPKMNAERHFVYLLHSVPKRKRFVRWPKKKKEENVVKHLAVYYDVSIKKAREYLRLHSPEELSMIVEMVDTLS